jgi:hypothetical protein
MKLKAAITTPVTDYSLDHRALPVNPLVRYKERIFHGRQLITDYE